MLCGLVAKTSQKSNEKRRPSFRLAKACITISTGPHTVNDIEMMTNPLHVTTVNDLLSVCLIVWRFVLSFVC